jgi:Chain length determinant protein
MQTQPRKQEDDEISLVDILLFIIASSRNVLLSSVVCLTVGIAYYLAAPKMYEASATIQMQMVAGELVEPPVALLERIKLPLFFSAETLQACGSDGDLSFINKFADKLKPRINKSAPLISFSAQAKSEQEARACLEKVIGEIQKSQNELAKPLIELKKEKLAQLVDQLKLFEDIKKSFAASKAGLNNSDPQFSIRDQLMLLTLINTVQMSYLTTEISTLKASLAPPRNQPLSLALPSISIEVVNKKGWFTFGLSLALGVLLGLLITGLMRVAPEIRRKMKEVKLS